MQRTALHASEQNDMGDLDRLTVTYAVLLAALMALNLAGYGLIAATI